MPFSVYQLRAGEHEVVLRRVARNDVREQGTVVGVVALLTDDRDGERAFRVALGQFRNEPGARHAVADDDDPLMRGASRGVLFGRTSRRTAHTLNSGIFDTGSRAGLVTRLTEPRPPQWKGMNTVSARTSSVTRAARGGAPAAADDVDQFAVAEPQLIGDVGMHLDERLRGRLA